VPLLKRVVPLFKYSSELKETITTSLMQKKSAASPSPASI
jgi:hypothetical protein